MPATAEPNALPVGDAGRDLDLERALLGHAAPSTTLRARLLGHAPVAVALVADHRAHHLPEHRARHGLQLTGAATPLARLDRCARLGAVAVAVLAAVDRLEGDVQLGAVGRFEQVELDRDCHVAALSGTSVPGGTAAEERVEEVGDRSEAIEVRGISP